MVIVSSYAGQSPAELQQSGDLDLFDQNEFVKPLLRSSAIDRDHTYYWFLVCCPGGGCGSSSSGDSASASPKKSLVDGVSHPLSLTKPLRLASLQEDPTPPRLYGGNENRTVLCKANYAWLGGDNDHAYSEQVRGMAEEGGAGQWERLFLSFASGRHFVYSYDCGLSAGAGGLVRGGLPLPLKEDVGEGRRRRPLEEGEERLPLVMEEGRRPSVEDDSLDDATDATQTHEGVSPEGNNVEGEKEKALSGVPVHV